MQVQIKFTRQGGSPMTGEFAPGDTLRCDPTLAEHFASQVKCATYVQAKTPAKPPRRAAAMTARSSANPPA